MSGLQFLPLKKRNNYANKVVLIAINKTEKGQHIFGDDVSRGFVVMGSFSTMIHPFLATT